MTQLMRTVSFVVSLTTALTACGGQTGTAITPAARAVSILAPSTERAQSAGGAAPGSFSIATSGGATCTGAAALFVACEGPAGSSATLTFTVPKGPLGYPPVSCGAVTWNTRKLFDKARSPKAHRRATSALGDAYYCGTATGTVTAVAPATAGYPSAVESSGQFQVCFALPVNPCAQTGTAGGTVLITSTGPGSGPPTPGPTPAPPGGGGGNCASSAVRPPSNSTRRPATGVIGGGGSPTPAPAGSPSPSPTPSVAPPCATPTALPDQNRIELLTADYPAGAPQYAFDTSYDGSETGIVGTASSRRRPAGRRALEQLAGGCVGDNTADGRVNGHIYLSSVVRCVGSVALSNVTYFVFDKDPNVPNSYRTFTKYVLPCGGGPTCRTTREDYVVAHTQVAKVVTYFEDNLGRSTNGELTMPYNERGVLYPIVYPFGYGGATSQQVPWPAPQFFPCSINSPININCSKIDLNFRTNLIKSYLTNSWPVERIPSGEVSPEWEAHHIKPRGWGGTNTVGNGVLLHKAEHQQFTNWWRISCKMAHGCRCKVATKAMDRYQTLAQAAADAVHAHGLTWHDERQPPATAESILRCEQRLGIALPNSYRAFLRCNDGVTLGIRRSPFVRYVIRLLGTAQIVDETQTILSMATDGFPGQSAAGLIVFADIMDGDFCLFDRSQTCGDEIAVIAADHENDLEGWRRTKIANDFGQWYSNVLSFVVESREHNEFRYWWADG